MNKIKTQFMVELEFLVDTKDEAKQVIDFIKSGLDWELDNLICEYIDKSSLEGEILYNKSVDVIQKSFTTTKNLMQGL